MFLWQMVCLQREDQIHAPCLDSTSTEILLPTDISLLFPSDMALFSVSSFVSLPIPMMFSMNIFGKLYLPFRGFSDFFFFLQCSEPGNVHCSLEDFFSLRDSAFLGKK